MGHLKREWICLWFRDWRIKIVLWSN